MSHWWRAYDEAVDDPKLLLLPSDRHRWGWFCLMCLASAYGGVLPSIDIVALKLRTSKHKAAELITVLVAAGLIDASEGSAFAPHNWNTRQYKSDVTDPTAAERMKRYRKNRNAVTAGTVTETVTVTPPRDRDREEDAAPAAPDPEKELFARGKQVLGNDAGGLIAKLLKAKNKNVVLARAVIDTASQKQDPREYVSAVIRGPKNGEFKLMSGREGII